MSILKHDSPAVHHREQIDLSGPDGNAYALLAKARRFSREIGHSPEQSEAIQSEMKAGDFDHLVRVFDREFGGLVDVVLPPSRSPVDA